MKLLSFTFPIAFIEFFVNWIEYPPENAFLKNPKTISHFFFHIQEVCEVLNKCTTQENCNANGRSMLKIVRSVNREEWYGALWE